MTIYDVEIADVPTDVVFSKGEQNEMSTYEDTSLIHVKQPEDELDFEKIKEIAKKAKKATVITEKPITNAELRAIPTYINDICRFVKKYASNGKFKFEYDCSKLSKACFIELADTFKQTYPLFFVAINTKTQMITVDWSGNHNV